nr:MAG TPA: hypothetical protein [Caudoviricetes sp.]
MSLSIISFSTFPCFAERGLIASVLRLSTISAKLHLSSRAFFIALESGLSSSEVLST